MLLFIIVLAFTGCKNDKKQIIDKINFSKKTNNSNIVAKNITKPNIILITIDTLRVDRLSLYSDKYIKTPNIDKLAKKSIVFNRAFSHNPLTLPSHINILTGTYPLYHGISDNARYKLDDKFLTITELLKSNNYKTSAFIGAFPLDSRFGLDQGFDLYDDNYDSKNNSSFLYIERSAKNVIKPAMDWISKQKTTWFTWIHLFDPHQPYAPPQPYKDKYKNDLYSGEVAYIDAQLGIFFDFLKKNNYLKNSIIIITADHGEALGEKGEKTHGYFAYNNTIHIPLIMYLPGIKSKNISTNVGHIDIFPTICEHIGLTIPKHIQGKSLIPLINGEKWDRESIYFESLAPYLAIGWAPLRGLINDDMKYIDLPLAELYDTRKDSFETKNIIDNTNKKNFKNELKKLLAKHKANIKPSKNNKLDKKTIKKIKTLGYLTGSNYVNKKKIYTKKDDLKILFPIYNKTYSAIAYFQKGDIDKSIKMLYEVIQDKPSFSLAYKNLAIIFEKQNKIEDALIILEKGLKKKPDNFELLYKFSSILSKSGNTKKAITILHKCIKIEDFNPDLYNKLGIAYFKEQNLKQALKYYNKSIELDANNTSFLLNRGLLFLTKDYIEKNGKYLQNAIDDFEKVNIFSPKNIKGFLFKSTALKRNKKIDDAIACLKTGLRINKDNGSLLVEIGIAYLDKGEKELALKFFKKFKTLYFSKMSQRNKEQIQSLINKTQKP